MTEKKHNQKSRNEGPAADLVICPLAVEHAPALRVLYAHSLKVNAEGFIRDPLFHGDIALRLQAFHADNGAALGLFSGENLLGFGALKPKGAGRVELCHLHLDLAYQGQGLGKKLSLALIETAKRLGYHTVELHVTATQKAAIGLYQKLGFVQTDRKVYHHENKQSFDTIFMEITL